LIGRREGKTDGAAVKGSCHCRKKKNGKRTKEKPPTEKSVVDQARSLFKTIGNVLREGAGRKVGQ